VTVQSESHLLRRRERDARTRERKAASGLCRTDGCRNPRAAGALSCEDCLERDRIRRVASTAPSEFSNGGREFWEAKAEGREPLNPFPTGSPEHRDFALGLREATEACAINARAEILHTLDGNTYRRRSTRAGGRPRKGSKA